MKWNQYFHREVFCSRIWILLPPLVHTRGQLTSSAILLQAYRPSHDFNHSFLCEMYLRWHVYMAAFVLRWSTWSVVFKLSVRFLALAQAISKEWQLFSSKKTVIQRAYNKVHPSFAEKQRKSWLWMFFFLQESRGNCCNTCLIQRCLLKKGAHCQGNKEKWVLGVHQRSQVMNCILPGSTTDIAFDKVEHVW